MHALLVIAAVSAGVAAAVGLFEIAVWCRAFRLRSLEARPIEAPQAGAEAYEMARESEVGEFARH